MADALEIHPAGCSPSHCFIALYGHPDSGGLWERHCETMLIEGGFRMPDPEGWPSVLFHPKLTLLFVVYVDTSRWPDPSSPYESMSKGWQLIASWIWIRPGKSIDILVAIMLKRRVFFFQLMIIHLPTYLTSPCLTRVRKPPPQRTGHNHETNPNRGKTKGMRKWAQAQRGWQWLRG